VSESVPEENLAVSFSGGVDSSMLGRISEELGKKITLVTIGFPGSHDIGFAKTIASKMGMKCLSLEIDHTDFQKNSLRVQQTISCRNISHIENCIAFFYICKLTRQNGFDIVVTANGCDELFCGYDGYRRVYTGGEEAITKMMDEKIANEFALMSEISAVASQFGISVRQPFLSSKFIRFAKGIPVSQKIKGADDMTRKHILRQLAISINVPLESAMKPKKALQYGSSIHKNFKKML